MTEKLENQVEAQAGTEEQQQKSTAREYLESLVVTVILALFGTTFLIQAFKIPSSSMEDTLLIGDHLMVNKVSYAPGGLWNHLLPYLDIQRDQIIVFRYPLDPATYFVKRVIGIPGDRIHLEGKRVFRNGVALNEPFVVHKSPHMEDFRDDFPELPATPAYPEWAAQLPSVIQGRDVVVPPDHFFAMGDNRDFSSDSRYWGFVPRENIVGKPLVIYWSFETSSDDYRRTSISDDFEKLTDVIFHFPQKTRWGRMFRLIH